MIIIETPTEPTRERLVVVPPYAVSREAGDKLLTVRTAAARDATPEDLARGGWVLDSDVLALTVRAEKAEAERNEERLNTARERDEARRAGAEVLTLRVERNAAQDRAEKAERERDEARADVAAVERQMREARSSADASFVRANQMERERDEARAALAAWQGSAACLVTRAVEANVDIRVCEDDGGGFMVGVHAPGDDEDLERHVPAADVPATLARLLGEVGE